MNQRLKVLDFGAGEFVRRADQIADQGTQHGLLLDAILLVLGRMA
jgi:hypothetical protein